uniref:Uncharacterized protein n=1 Tax=Anguilla anguilla TaxID=7936 RepID=A0A0E9Y0E5_ANGAN
MFVKKKRVFNKSISKLFRGVY